MDLLSEEKHNWPTSREAKDRTISDKDPKQSEDIDIKDHLIEELLTALDQKNVSYIRDCLVSLIYTILEEEEQPYALEA